METRFKTAPFIQESFLFLGSIFLAVLAADKLNQALRIGGALPSPAQSAAQFSITEILLAILVGTVLILLLVRFLPRYKTGALRFLFVLAIFGGINIFFSSFLNQFAAAGVALALTLIRLFRPTLLNHNLVILLSVAGVAAALGLGLKPQNVIVLLIIVSIYDIIAVYQTKHMVKLAQELIAANTMVGFIVPQALPMLALNPGEAKPGQGFLFLGAGDAIFPTFLAVAVLPQGLAIAFLVGFGALTGLLANMLFFVRQTRPKPMPALPLIAAGSIIGLGISSLL